MTDYLKHHNPCGHFHRRFIETGSGGHLPGGSGLVYSEQNGREFFSVMPLSGGFLVGDYGLTRDGAQIGFLGSSLSVETKPSPPRESFMDIILPADGLPVATTEHYGSIYKRNSGGSSGSWSLRYSMSQPVLMMFLVSLGGTLYANWYDFSGQTSGLVSSGDNGTTWGSAASYGSNKVFCICEDGSNIYLAGQSGSYPVLMNSAGGVIASNGGRPGWCYWGVYSSGGVTNMGSYSLMYQKNNQPGFIDVWDGAICRTVLNTAQPYVHVITEHGGKRYAVSTNAWDQEGDSYIYASDDGLGWNQVSHVPCGHIIGHWAAADALYLAGGKYGEYGAIYKYNY